MLRLASGYKAALYALEVHDRVAAVLKSTAVSDVRRWVWHPTTTPLHRCNNGEAVALRTRCRMGLAAAIGINWYEKLMDDDRKSCILCGLRDRDVVQPSAVARQDDEVTRSAAPQRAFCVTHVFGECALAGWPRSAKNTLPSSESSSWGSFPVSEITMTPLDSSGRMRAICQPATQTQTHARDHCWQSEHTGTHTDTHAHTQTRRCHHSQRL